MLIGLTQPLYPASRVTAKLNFERAGEGLVRVDGGVFRHSVYVGDPGAKSARPDDKVVFEMLRFPSLEDRGEGVITEVLGARGQPGVQPMSDLALGRAAVVLAGAARGR